MQVLSLLGIDQLESLPEEASGMLNLLMLLCKQPAGLCRSDLDLILQEVEQRSMRTAEEREAF